MCRVAAALAGAVWAALGLFYGGYVAFSAKLPGALIET